MQVLSFWTNNGHALVKTVTVEIFPGPKDEKVVDALPNKQNVLYPYSKLEKL